MQLFYTIHDAENNRVGFAPAIHDEDEVIVFYEKDTGMMSSVKKVKTTVKQPAPALKAK